MQRLQLLKVEELTLSVVALKKEIGSLKAATAVLLEK